MSDCRSTIDSSMHLEPVLASFASPCFRHRIREEWAVWMESCWYLIFDDWCSGHRSWVAVVGARMEGGGLFARMRVWRRENVSFSSFIVLAKLESGEAMKTKPAKLDRRLETGRPAKRDIRHSTFDISHAIYAHRP
ncbi:hypothetical protein BZA77DRAFT_345768 [Pyronema omphalodes]|nr:hypothetical protein BZA77DRAFT_345768 [Pyronema omphalodes]